MPITITTHQEVFLVEHDTIAGMLRETADLVEELQERKQGTDVEIELEVGLIGCRLSHGIRVFYPPRPRTPTTAPPTPPIPPIRRIPPWCCPRSKASASRPSSGGYVPRGCGPETYTMVPGGSSPT